MGASGKPICIFREAQAARCAALMREKEDTRDRRQPKERQTQLPQYAPAAAAAATAAAAAAEAAAAPQAQAHSKRQSAHFPRILYNQHAVNSQEAREKQLLQRQTETATAGGQAGCSIYCGDKHKQQGERQAPAAAAATTDTRKKETRQDTDSDAASARK